MQTSGWAVVEARVVNVVPVEAVVVTEIVTLIVTISSGVKDVLEAEVLTAGAV